MSRKFPGAVALSAALLTGVQTGFIAMAAAQTAQNISSYTSTDPKQCRQVAIVRGEDGGGTRTCPGPSGLVVVVSEYDLRETVTVGKTRKAAEAEPAASTWFEPFSSTTPTIEWRQDAKNKPPFAMIQRWHLADINDEDKNGRPKTKQLFVVTRLAPAGAKAGMSVCHVAYIDVKANPDAIELARDAADSLARDFKCDTGKVKVVGASGRGVELALPR